MIMMMKISNFDKKGKIMLLIDNTSKLKNVMEFKSGSYYKFVALIRAKDYKDSNEQVLASMEKQEILVRDWMIDSEEMLNKLLPDMLKYTELFKCRLYMCTDRKNVVKTLIQMRNKIQIYLDQFLSNPNAPQCSIRSLRKIGASASNISESSDKSCCKWLFDVDTKNKNVLKFIKEKICGENYLETFETKAGYHVLAQKKFPLVLNEYESEFDYLRNKFPEISVSTISSYVSDVNVKENAMVLIAMGE